MKILTLTITTALLALPAVSASADTRDKATSVPASDAALQPSRSAHDLIGRELTGSTGEKLGEIKDLVVDMKDGKIIYALVGSGGFLGVNEALRAVPFAALHPSSRDLRDFTLNIDRARWGQAPTMPANRLDLLGEKETAKATFTYYGSDMDGDFTRHDPKDGDRLLRVSNLKGRDVTNGGVKVGEIEDLIVHLNSRRVLALLDPENNYTGSDRKFLIDVHQLNSGPEQRLTTTLTRDQFANVTAPKRNWWEDTSDRPLAWNGYGSLNPAVYSTADGAATTSSAEVAAARERSRSEVRTDLAVLRERLRNDSTLSERARRVKLEERGGRLVVSGTVESDNVKKYVIDSIDELARGWQIDNQLKVQAAAE